jgi:hypothetical protein
MPGTNSVPVNIVVTTMLAANHSINVRPRRMLPSAGSAASGS